MNKLKAGFELIPLVKSKYLLQQREIFVINISYYRICD